MDYGISNLKPETAGLGRAMLGSGWVVWLGVAHQSKIYPNQRIKLLLKTH